MIMIMVWFIRPIPMVLLLLVLVLVVLIVLLVVMHLVVLHVFFGSIMMHRMLLVVRMTGMMGMCVGTMHRRR